MFFRQSYIFIHIECYYILEGNDIQPDYQSVSQWAAHYVAAKIKAANPTPEKPFVLGCPTGSSPLGMYKALIDLNKKGIVSKQF